MTKNDFVSETILEKLLETARVNIFTGEYTFIKEYEQERRLGCLEISDMDEYPKKIVENNLIHPDDVCDYLYHMRLDYLRRKILEGKRRIVHSFRREKNGIFAWITVEIIVPDNFSRENPWVLYSWRDADNDSRAMEDALGMLSLLFHKIMKINLTLDTYESIKVYQKEMKEERGFSLKASGWLSGFAKCGNVHEDDLTDYMLFTNVEHLRSHFKKSREAIRCRYRRKTSGVFRWVTMTVLPSVEYRDDNQVVLVYIRDIHDAYTEEIEQQKKLEYYCNYDIMTGLHNRYYYKNACQGYENEKESCRQVMAVFADINGLKYVNDHYGHDAGDIYIKNFADRLSEAFGAQNCCRISGDEFVVLLKGGEKATKEKAEHFRDSLSEGRMPLAAVGYAWAQETDSIENLVSKAEAAMYENKQSCYKRYPEFKRRLDEEFSKLCERQVFDKEVRSTV